MAEAYRTIRIPTGEIETVIKKSRFIAQILPVDSPEDAAEKLAAIKKRHYNARHTCSATIIGERAEFMRSSDDGEPQGTGGIPMLEVLKQNRLTGVLVAVTRYFGGVLLGAPGLVRAYSDGAAKAVAAAEIVEARPFTLAKTRLSFALWARAEGTVRANAMVHDIEYGADVAVTLCIEPGNEDKLTRVLGEVSSGTAQLDILDTIFLDVPVRTGKQAE